MVSEVKVFNISKSLYSSIHNWAKKNIEKPLNCMKCSSDDKLELSNKSHTYKKAIEDWEWLCRSCHKLYHKFKHTEEAKKRIAKNCTGEKNGFYGKNWNDFGGHPKGMKGKKHSKETKLLQGEASKEMWKTRSRKMSEEQKVKISNSAKVRIPWNKKVI